MGFEKWYKYGNDLLNEIKTTQVPPDAAAIWFFGQASFAVKANDKIVYIDPFFNEYRNPEGVSKRVFPPPFTPDAVNNADYVLCTHRHNDHLDLYSLTAIAASSPKAVFIVPYPHRAVLTGAGIGEERVLGAYDGQALALDKCRVIPNGCPHDIFETDENGNHLHMGYALEINRVTIYHSGDTVEWPEMCDMLRQLSIDIIMLPINGSDWKRKKSGIIGNLNAREAADIMSECSADLIIPMHFDLFARNAENPAHFADYMYSLHPNKKFHIMTRGERFIYLK